MIEDLMESLTNIQIVVRFGLCVQYIDLMHQVAKK